MTTLIKSGAGGMARRLAAAGVALGLAVAPAAAASAQEGTPDARKVFTIGIQQDPDSLNPFNAFLGSAYEAQGIMYELLTGWSETDFGPVPNLADSWEKSPDGLTWTFNLHPGVKWSDGQPLTAKDVAYTFNRLIENDDEGAKYDAYIKNITNVVAVNDTTARFALQTADPIMEHLWVPIIPEHIWKDITGDEVASYANEENVVGYGPFTLVERKVGEFVRFAPNPNYHLGAPKIDELVFKIFDNEDAMVQALIKGEIDAIDSVGANQFNALRSQPGITTVRSDGLGFNEIAFNMGAATTEGNKIGDGHPALLDKQVRLAIAHSIDTEALVRTALRGYGTPGTSIIPPAYEDIHYTPATPYAFDLAKANGILDAAGYTRGGDGVRVDPASGRKLEFRLFGREESPESQQAVQLVQGWLDQIGIATKLQIMNEDKLTEVVGQGEFDLFEWGWGVEPDPDFQMSVFKCDQRSIQDGETIYAGWSDSFYCNPAYDALYAQQSTQLVRAERAATLKQMQQMIYEDLPYVLTWYDDSLQAYSNKWAGFVPDASGAVFFQYGSYSYRNIDLASEFEKDGGLGTGVLVGAGVAAAIALIGGGIALARSRSTAGERE